MIDGSGGGGHGGTVVSGSNEADFWWAQRLRHGLNEIMSFLKREKTHLSRIFILGDQVNLFLGLFGSPTELVGLAIFLTCGSFDKLIN